MIHVIFRRFALALSVAVAVAPAGGAAATPIPSLKSAVTVTGDLVRIGDLFDHAGARAGIAIFRAPDPGETGTVPTAQVIAAVREHNMFLFDTRQLSAVSVSRAGRVISPKEVMARITAALSTKSGLGDPTMIAVTCDTELRPLHVESTATGEIRVARLSYDPRTRRFYAVLDLPGNTYDAPLRVTGTAVETVDVAVVKQSADRGTVLRAADIAIERRPKSEISADAITDIDTAAGLATQRTLRAGHVLRHGDLTKPDLVLRNDIVSVVYRAPGITLSARGKALENGTEGAVISVLNEQSKRTIHARVVAPGQVVVVAQGPRLAANIPAAADSSPPAARFR